MFVFRKNKKEERKHDILVARRQSYVSFLNAVNDFQNAIINEQDSTLALANYGQLFRQMNLLRLFAPDKVVDAAYHYLSVAREDAANTIFPDAAAETRPPQETDDQSALVAEALDQLIAEMRTDLADELVTGAIHGTKDQ